MKIGDMQTTKQQDGGYSGRGRVQHPDIYFGFTMKPIDASERSSDGAPTHRLYRKDEEGTDWEVGSAWQRALKRGEHEGKAMFSLSFDDPALPHWTGNIAAFPDDDQGNYQVVHNRKKKAA